MQLIEQAGPDSLKIVRDPRLGIISAVLKCWAPDRQTATFADPLDIGFAIPEWNPRKIDRRDAGESAGYDVFVSYEGHADPNNAEGEYFEIEGSTREDPIETHWNYSVLLTTYNGHEDATGRATWPKTLKDATGKTGRNKMHGVEAWPSPGLIWNHNWCSPTLPVGIAQQLGTITKAPPGDPPELSGDRDWLCIRVRGRERGNIWQMQTSYELSGPFGSVPEMYQQP